MAGFINQITRFAVPFFFLCSGYFLQPKLSSGAPLGVALRYCRPLLILWLVWSLLYAVIPFDPIGAWQYGYLESMALQWQMLLSDPLNQWWVGGMVHLWFLPALMLAVLILALCQQVRRPGLALALGATLYLLALLGGSYGKPVLGAEWAVITRNGPFFSLLFVALGFMIRQHHWRLSSALALRLLVVGMLGYLLEGLLLKQLWEIPFGRHDFLLSSVPQLILAVFIAAMLDQNIRAKTFWRMGVLLPYVMAPVAVALIFSNMFGDQYGIINTWLGSIGIDAVKWHSNAFASHIAIATMVNFRWTGYNTLILLAAMQAIPRDYYEAATVDGAGKIRQFFAITLPSLRPTLIFVIITSTIGGLQIFDEPRMYDQFGTGGANYQWLTITLWLYDLGWGQWNFGRAAALAWILFLIILVIGVINLFITRSLVRDEGARGALTRTQLRAARRDAKAAVATDRAARADGASLKEASR